MIHNVTEEVYPKNSTDYGVALGMSPHSSLIICSQQILLVGLVLSIAGICVITKLKSIWAIRVKRVCIYLFYLFMEGGMLFFTLQCSYQISTIVRGPTATPQYIFSVIFAILTLFGYIAHLMRIAKDIITHFRNFGANSNTLVLVERYHYFLSNIRTNTMSQCLFPILSQVRKILYGVIIIMLRVLVLRLILIIIIWFCFLVYQVIVRPKKYAT
jgi:hypothetical protein